jgi:FKBP-type peptidyl-prolyl cis-trans isomerase SlyD
MPDTSSVQDGLVVSIEYTLKDDGGQVLDASEGNPLLYLHGHDNIVPGLEQELTGKNIGDKVDVSVPPKLGYGERVGPGPQAIDRSSFPADAPLHPGINFLIETDDGHMPLWITEVKEDVVMVDANHPLAGVTLNFSVEIVAIREASAEEIAHGHPHGPGGHHH